MRLLLLVSLLVASTTQAATKTNYYICDEKDKAKEDVTQFIFVKTTIDKKVEFAGLLPDDKSFLPADACSAKAEFPEIFSANLSKLNEVVAACSFVNSPSTLVALRKRGRDYFVELKEVSDDIEKADKKEGKIVSCHDL